MPPNTMIVAQYPTRNVAQFFLSADEQATFACSLDGASYQACSSPVLYRDLPPGWHTVAVRATDAAGNVDPTPAHVRWHARGGG